MKKMENTRLLRKDKYFIGNKWFSFYEFIRRMANIKHFFPISIEIFSFKRYLRQLFEVNNNLFNEDFDSMVWMRSHLFGNWLNPFPEVRYGRWICFLNSWNGWCWCWCCCYLKAFFFCGNNLLLTSRTFFEIRRENGHVHDLNVLQRGLALISNLTFFI